jgi:hypothetical protein
MEMLWSANNTLQLHRQAFTVSVLLQNRCRFWAGVAGTTVPGEAEPVAQPQWPDSAAQGSELNGRWAVAEVKNPRRAAEKARTCYGGDVSQLLDICRQEREKVLKGSRAL